HSRAICARGCNILAVSTGSLRRAVVEAGEHLRHGILTRLLGSLKAYRTADQLMTARYLQIVRNPGAVRHIGYRQLMAYSQTQNLAQARGFIQFRQYAACEAAALV